MTQKRQGGLVLSFVVIGGVLVLLLLGGVYFVRQRTSVEAINQPAPTPTSEQTKTQSDKAKEDEAAKEQKDKTSSETKSSTNSSSSNTTTALPQTGPAETVGVLLALALVTGAFTAYIRSKREFLSL